MDDQGKKLNKYLTPVSVWALSFGCAVGWGAFVMPGTTFLPMAGPVGTALGIAIGAVIMFIIGVNYHYLMNKYPSAGGTMTYTIKTFGYDHGFLASWFLVLVYIAIIWANASALALIGRNLLGTTFQFGFHYTILGYDVYLGEILLSMIAILIFGTVCIYSKRLSAHIQTVLAVILISGIVITFIAVLKTHSMAGLSFTPDFSPSSGHPLKQIFAIIILAPWAYVGFESVSQSTKEFKFPIKKSIIILGIALLTSAAAYILLALISASVWPEGYDNWADYINNLDNIDGIAGLPAFYATKKALGTSGLIILGITLLGAVCTGLIGNSIAAARLIYSMSEEKMLPRWFGKLNSDGSPRNAFIFLMIISAFIPLLGRTAIGWIVDVNTIGATIAYGYTAAVATVSAKRDDDKKYVYTGAIGLLISLILFFYFMAFSGGALSTESYLILAVWSILGFIMFRAVFRRDNDRRFGKSTVVWLGLLFLIFFTSLMWVKQATDDMTRRMVDNIQTYYENNSTGNDIEADRRAEAYVEEQMRQANEDITRNSIIQMILMVAGLAIMFSIYTTVTKREKQAEIERGKAEESSKAKSTFLSNMSHDIRTPMNAIIGYVNLSESPENDEAKLREYMSKIKTSSQHLLALINDVLEMSRIESGKMDLEPIKVNLKKTIKEVQDMFSTQMSEKQIDFFTDIGTITHPVVMCDKNRLNRVLLNLLSNAYKFTPEHGNVSVTLWEIANDSDTLASFELRVRDSGIGMTKEFADKVFEAFERERTSTVSGIQGTGLGMAITKSIVDLMGGEIKVVTAPGEGTEFIIKLTLEIADDKNFPIGDSKDDAGDKEKNDDTSKTIDYSKLKVLLVEDMMVNREIALMLLKNIGFTDIDTAENGQIALDKVKASATSPYDLVFMDIQMPVMDGYAAASSIRELDDPHINSIPIIAMTANAFSEDVKKAIDAGMNAHIAKPIDTDVMKNTIDEIITG